METDEVMFQAILKKDLAQKFDEIAEKSFRSRAQHLKFIIEKEVDFHEERDVAS